MKKLITAIALATTVGFAGTAMAATDVAQSTNSHPLYTLATTGSGDALAAEYGGISLHHVGGSPGAFEYIAGRVLTDDFASDLLGDGEFLAPHFWQKDGMVFIMVAPHLFIDGELNKGAGPKDNWVQVKLDELGNPIAETAERYDYSDDVVKTESGSTITSGAQYDDDGNIIVRGWPVLAAS